MTDAAEAAHTDAARSLVVPLQVIISFTLFFVCVPLVHFTNSKARMGRWRNIFAARWFGIIVTLIIGGLNGYLIISSIKVRGAARRLRLICTLDIQTQPRPCSVDLSFPGCQCLCCSNAGQQVWEHGWGLKQPTVVESDVQHQRSVTDVQQLNSRLRCWC
jgi:hypothetical protein